MSIKQALADIAKGKMIIVTDDENRENEGDLIMAAEKVTPKAINFMIKQAGGLVCLAMDGAQVDRLQLNFMNPHRTLEDFSTPFTMSIDARYGTTTGISAMERAHTILTAVNPNSTAADLITPGHIFPLRARANGVLERPGHTEAAVDLARLAGLKPAGVICEIIGEDGSMLRGKDLMDYATQHQLTTISVQQLIDYRRQFDTMQVHPSIKAQPIEKTATCQLNTEYGEFELHVFMDHQTQQEHTALVMGDLTKPSYPLIRVHSSCLTGDVFQSEHCDCGWQLKKALEKISDEGVGAILYLNQEGRSIGLTNKIRAYALQQQGYNTIEANLALGLPVDARNYTIAAEILRQLQVSNMRLMTNNPVKIQALTKLLSAKVKHIPHEILGKSVCKHYLQTKRDQLGHLLNLMM